MVLGKDKGLNPERKFCLKEGQKIEKSYQFNLLAVLCCPKKTD